MKLESITVQDLLDIADFIYLAIDLNQNVVLINKKGCEILGYSEDEIVGKNWFDNFLPKSIIKETKKLFNQRIKEKKVIKTTGVNPILTKNSEERIIGWQNSYIINEEGKISGVLSAGMDITEETNIRKELIEREKILNSIIENSPFGFVAFEGEDIIVITNPSIREMLGYSHEELIEKTLIAITHPEDIEISLEMYEKAKSKEITSSIYEKRYFRKDGSTLYARVITWYTYDSEGEVVYNFGAIEDITSQKQSEEVRKTIEEELRHSEYRYRTIFDIGGTAITITDEEGIYNLVNSKAEELFCCSKEELVDNKHWTDFIAEDEYDRIIEINDKRRIDPTSVPDQYESKIKDLEGKVKNVLINVRVNPETQEKITSLMDITNLKKAEKLLKDSEEKFRLIFENASDGFALMEEDGTLIDVNERTLSYFGNDKSEIIGKDIREIGPYADEDFLEEVLSTVGEINERKYETVGKRKDGSIFNLDVSASLIRLEDKEIIFSINRDITESKRLEKELKENEEKFRNVFNYSYDGYLLHEYNGKIIDANPTLQNLIGYSKSELIGKQLQNFDYIVDQESYLAFENTINKEGYSLLETELKRKDKSKIPVDLYSRKIDLSGKEVYFTVIRDLTQQKEALKALVESETKFKSIFNNSHDGYILRSLEGEILDINTSIIEIFGYTQEDVLAGNVKELQPFESQEELQQVMKDVETKGFTHYETKARKKDGTIFPIEVKSFKFFIGAEEVVLGVVRDISQRKETERVLVESENRLRNLVDNIPIAIATMTSKGEIIDVNPAHWKLLGYNSKEEHMQAKLSDTWINIKDREKLYVLLEKEKEVKDYTVRIRRKDGSVFWCSISAILHSDTSGKVISYQIIQDITTQKEIEDELREQIMKYKLEETNLYVAEEETAYFTVEAFNDLLKLGYEGIIFSRTPETKWKEKVENNFNFYKLAEKGTGRIISPNLEKIEQIIEDLPNRQIILLDRVDYLIQKNGFENTLFFFYRLTDIAYLANHIILVSIDSSLLSLKERNLIYKEFKPIETKIESIVPEDLFEVLMFIYQQNLSASKPTISDVIGELNISRPTARKRIYSLIDEGYILESTKGRSKVLQITQKGKMLF